MSLLAIVRSAQNISISTKMANRHGLITGATGTGKTVSLQVIAENFSASGIPVFMADVKGDLSGVSQPGSLTPKMAARIAQIKVDAPLFAQYPVQLWDVFGSQGHPIRSTVSDMGPLLLGKLLDLSDIQKSVLTLIFKIADDNGLLLLDLKDLRSTVQYIGDNAKQFTTQYGNIAPASVGAIQRALIGLEQQGAEAFFGEPALDLYDLIKTDSMGKGVINILCADKLILSPKVYSTFLLWLLSELFERLPEAGDLDRPKLAFFFDEAHLLFNDIEKPLLDKIEQVVRLVRSKGVGVYFITQNPNDIPDVILGQLGNRIQHALRAFTPNDQKAVKAAANTFRQNPALGKLEDVITQLSVGEALVSFLDEQGQPAPVERAWVLPPRGQIGPITPDQRQRLIQSAMVYGKYETEVDRESAHEKLAARAQQTLQAAQTAQQTTYQQQPVGGQRTSAPARGGRPPQTIFDAMAKSAARSVGSTVGRQIIRGVLGSILGGGRR